MWDSGFSSRISLPFTVARAVAALHRSSRSPQAHRVIKEDIGKEPEHSCYLPPIRKLLNSRRRLQPNELQIWRDPECKCFRANSKSKQTEMRPEVEEWVKALSGYSQNRDALDLLLQKIEGVKKLSVCLLR
jgi:hypothetical protein